MAPDTLISTPEVTAITDCGSLKSNHSASSWRLDDWWSSSQDDCAPSHDLTLSSVVS
jgi:hypothetical protein